MFHRFSPLSHGSPTCSHAMRPSDPAALHVQLRQDAGGDVAVAEAEAGAEQKLMLLRMELGKAVVALTKGSAIPAQSPHERCSAQAKHCSIFDHKAPAASMCCSVGAEGPDSGIRQLLLTGMESGQQARYSATV